MDLDNNSTSTVDFLHLFEAGVTLLVTVPGKQAVEWVVKGVHIIGALRGNCGSGKAVPMERENEQASGRHASREASRT